MLHSLCEHASTCCYSNAEPNITLVADAPVGAAELESASLRSVAPNIEHLSMYTLIDPEGARRLHSLKRHTALCSLQAEHSFLAGQDHATRVILVQPDWQGLDNGPGVHPLCC